MGKVEQIVLALAYQDGHESFRLRHELLHEAIASYSDVSLNITG